MTYTDHVVLLGRWNLGGCDGGGKECIQNFLLEGGTP